MKAVRLHHYHEQPRIEQVDEPKITGPHDVIVRIGGAGLCRTDLHIIEGQWAEKSGVTLPYTLGHENAGWVHEIGSAVSNVAVGDTVIVHPLVTCGLCRPCRAGNDMHCINSAFPGISVDGGMANFLKTSARSVVKLNPSLQPRYCSAGRCRSHCLPCREESVAFAVSGYKDSRDRSRWSWSHRYTVSEGVNTYRDHRC